MSQERDEAKDWTMHEPLPRHSASAIKNEFLLVHLPVSSCTDVCLCHVAVNEAFDLVQQSCPIGIRSTA